MREAEIIKNSPQGEDFGVLKLVGINLHFQEFQNELKRNIFRRALRKLKMAICRHNQVVPIFKTRHYTTTPGTNFRFWQDTVAGTGCCDCGKIIPLTMPFDIGNIDCHHRIYSARKPHFPEF